MALLLGNYQLLSKKVSLLTLIGFLMSDKVNFVIISLDNFFASKSALILAKANHVFKAAFILAK